MGCPAVFLLTLEYPFPADSLPAACLPSWRSAPFHIHSVKSHPSWPLPGPAILCIALVTESYSLCSLKVSLHHTLNILQPTNHALQPGTLSCPPKVLPSHRLLHLRSSPLEDQAVTIVPITPGGEASGFFSSFTSQSTQATRLSMAQSTLHPGLPSLIKWGAGSAPSPLFEANSGIHKTEGG